MNFEIRHANSNIFEKYQISQFFEIWYACYFDFKIMHRIQKGLKHILFKTSNFRYNQKGFYMVENILNRKTLD